MIQNGSVSRELKQFGKDVVNNQILWKLITDKRLRRSQILKINRSQRK
jgi:hypothetical protein